MQLKHYLVFAGEGSVRDAQIYCGQSTECDNTIDPMDDERNWVDASGPMLLLDIRAKNLNEAVAETRSQYPDMSLSQLDFYEVTGMRQQFVLNRD